MKKLIYIILLIAITTGLKAQFAGVLTNDGFTRLENDSALLTPDENLRGSFQWQNSPDSIIWTNIDANLTGDTLAFAVDSTEAYRLMITDGTCSAIYSDTVKVFNKNTTVPEYQSAGISTSDLLDGGVSVAELLDAGISVSELIAAGAIINGLSGVSTDQDGNDFDWVGISNQIWMAENLKTTKYNNGTDIPLVTDNTTWAGLSIPAYCWHGNDSVNAQTYGALYNWYTVATSNLCPSDWHVPSDDELKQLEMYLGMSQSEADDSGWRGTNEGSKLAGNASLWNDGSLENNAAFGSSGFHALPGGFRHYNGTFINLGYDAYFWSATEHSSSDAWSRYLYYDRAEAYRYNDGKTNGFSVRCTKD